MEGILIDIETFITTLLDSLGIYGPILGCFLILIESMIPILPLSAFVTLNFYAFGQVKGFIISYLFTLAGCNMSFYLWRTFFRNRYDILVKKYGKSKTLKLIGRFSEIKFRNLVLILAFPFTPAFLINILGGLSTMPHKKYLAATAVAKTFMVYFWGYMGVTLIESLTHPIYFVKVVIMLLVAYIISTIINKKYDLD